MIFSVHVFFFFLSNNYFGVLHSFLKINMSYNLNKRDNKSKNKHLSIFYKMSAFQYTKNKINFKNKKNLRLPRQNKLHFTYCKINKFLKMSRKDFPNRVRNFISFLHQNSWITRLTSFQVYVGVYFVCSFLIK